MNLKRLLKALKKGVTVELPKQAGEEYFKNMECEIMGKIGENCEATQNICECVKASLVDFCEGELNETATKMVKDHIAVCESCHNEYMLTEQVLRDSEQVFSKEVESQRTHTYFDKLPNKIDEKIHGYCEKAQEYIVNIYTDEPVPTEIEAHLKECVGCKKIVAQTETLLENLHRLSVPMPNEKYFQHQLYRIDRAVEALPSKRIAKVESKEIAGYFTGIFDTIRSTLMQPYAAIAVSAMVALLIIGGRFYSSKDSIEEKQINLSEVINNTRAVAGIENDNDFNVHQAKAITDPIEDERIQINSTGTAKKEDEKDKNKKLN